MMIVGLDLGNGNMKVSTKTGNLIIRSACEIEQTPGYGSCDYIQVDGIRYAMGKGTGMSKNDKSKDNVYKICLLYALAKLGDSSYKVATGLPISYFKLYRNALVDMYKGKTFDVILESGQSKTAHRITIEDMIVLPEGILCVQDKVNKNLVIDIGSHTVDVALFEKGAHIKSDTFIYGMNDLYSKIAKDLKSNGSDCTELDAENYVINKTYVLNEKVVAFDSSVYRNQQLDLILRAIGHSFPLESSTKTFVGGGSIVYQDLLLARGYDVKVDENTMFLNSNKFKEYGFGLWDKK